MSGSLSPAFGRVGQIAKYYSKGMTGLQTLALVQQVTQIPLLESKEENKEEIDNRCGGYYEEVLRENCNVNQ